MSQMKSSNPFDEDYEDEDVGAFDSVGAFVLGDENPLKYTSKADQGGKRSAPVSFTNPFQDDTPNRNKHQRPPFSPASLWSSNHSPRQSPQQHFYHAGGGEIGTVASSEMSPLLPDDMSRSYRSNASSKGTPSRLGSLKRRTHSVPTRIFTGSSDDGSSSSRRNRPRRSGSKRRHRSNSYPHNAKSDIILTELAGGDDHHDNDHESIQMEYKYILLEDLGTAASWTILVLPYATFFVSVMLLYLGSTPVAAMGSTVTVLRLSCCSIMLCFIAYWIWKMEMIRLFCCRCSDFSRAIWRKLRNCISSQDEDDEWENPDLIHWWENPWVLFPERYYILPLLVSSLLVLEPILVVIYFFPTLETPTLNAIAEASAGAGIQACSLFYLCLVEGFRYHSGARSKRRAELQRKALQLRRAAKLLSDGKDDHKDFVSSPKIVKNYYDEFGDIDGSTFIGHLRLPNDPCSDGWADFLLPKLLLMLVGILSATLACFTRPSNQNLFPNATLYAIGSIVYGIALYIWTYLIIMALYITGNRLKREPFLGTRPAQLAYRVLFAHSGLAIVGLGIASVGYFKHLRGLIELDGIARIVQDGELILGHPGHLSFPRMFGRLVCLAVQVAITAFIFLPPHTMDFEEHGDDDETNELTDIQIQIKNRRDKRRVIPLAKDSRTWRIFPCPIQNRGVSSTNPFQDSLFQVYKDFHTDRNTHHRGLVSIGPYTPVFCAELACWLNEASWQAYYSPVGSPESRKHLEDSQRENNSYEKSNGKGDEKPDEKPDADNFCGWMRLDIIGLQLEGYVYDKRTNTQAYIATNSAPQVDGEEDSIIVVGFRGTSDATNVKTDFRFRQVPLYDQITGTGESPFRVFPDRLEVNDSDGWVWDTNTSKGSSEGEFVTCVGCWSDNAPPVTPTHTPAKQGRQRLYSVGGMEAVVSKETVDILKGAPLARNSFPMVHEGFQDAYSEIRKQLFDLLLPVLQRQLEKSIRSKPASAQAAAAAASKPLALPKIYCTGHSLGGSLAQLFALDLASNCELVIPLQQPLQPRTPKTPFGISVEPQTRFFPLSPPPKAPIQHELRLQPPIGLYTYGQPRVGNRAFARLYKQRVPHSFRVVNEGDAFTAIPNYFFCGGLYKHAGLEVILDAGMTGNVLVGPTVVETLFRFHKVRTNLLAHQMERYRECLECIFDNSQLLQYYKDHNIAYEELLADRKPSSDNLQEKQRKANNKAKNADYWKEGGFSDKDGLEWYS